MITGIKNLMVWRLIKVRGPNLYCYLACSYVNLALFCFFLTTLCNTYAKYQFLIAISVRKQAFNRVAKNEGQKEYCDIYSS
jgi:hypothetical protein